MIEIQKSDFFETGKEGVKRILTPDDKKIDIIEFDDKKLCYVKSGMGYPAIYPMHETHFEKKADAILMAKNVDGIYDLYESYDVRTKTNFLELIWNDEEKLME